VLRGKFNNNAYIRKEERSEINSLNFYLRTKEKENTKGEE
jgi:hypothetical protein